MKKIRRLEALELFLSRRLNFSIDFAGAEVQKVEDHDTKVDPGRIVVKEACDIEIISSINNIYDGAADSEETKRSISRRQEIGLAAMR